MHYENYPKALIYLKFQPRSNTGVTFYNIGISTYRDRRKVDSIRHIYQLIGTLHMHHNFIEIIY